MDILDVRLPLSVWRPFQRSVMSPIDYIRATYRLRKDLVPELVTLTTLGLILSYHAMRCSVIDWLFH
jgi:hypothetical protein